MFFTHWKDVKRKPASLLTKIVVMALLVYLSVSLLNVRSDIREVRQAQEILMEQNEAKTLENKELSEAIEHKDDPETMEEAARKKGLVKQDEELYIDVAN